MMAAAPAHGTTYRKRCPEPEVVDLANFINRMGRFMLRNNVIKIEGRKRLYGCTYTPIPDGLKREPIW